MVPASEEGNRVPINRETQVRTLWHLEALGEVAEHARQIAWLVTLEQQVPAPAILDSLDWARRRPDDRHRGPDLRNERVQPRSTAGGEASGGFFARPAE